MRWIWRTCLSTCLTIVLATGQIMAQAPPRSVGIVDALDEPKSITDKLARIAERHATPAMAAVVVQGSRIVADGVVGIRERAHPEAVTIDDKFHLGSVTKSMTATLCAILVEKGQLRWNMTIAEALPELKSSMLPEYRNVTLEQLLTQRSGFAERENGPEIWQTLVDFQGTLPEARRQCVQKVLMEKPRTPPGSAYLYCNYNYVVAGHIIETVARRPWEELIREYLFIPLGMKSAGFGAPGHADSVDQPCGHRSTGEPLQPGPAADNPAFCGPSGTVHCSLPDWAKFVAAHATEGESCPGLLPRESFVKLHTPVFSDAEKPQLEKMAAGFVGYGMGWFVFDRGTLLVHEGTNTYWYASQLILPKEQLSVLVACNQGGDEAEAACREASAELLKQFRKPVGK